MAINAERAGADPLSDPPWVSRRLWLVDSDLGLVGLLGRGLVVGLRPPPPLPADELAKLGCQIASTEGMRLESARVTRRALWKPAHVEFRFLR